MYLRFQISKRDDDDDNNNNVDDNDDNDDEDNGGAHFYFAIRTYSYTSVQRRWTSTKSNSMSSFPFLHLFNKL